MREWLVLGGPALLSLVVVFALMVTRPPDAVRSMAAGSHARRWLR